MRAFVPNPDAEDEMLADEMARAGLMDCASSIAARADAFANPILVPSRSPTPHIQAEDTDDGVAVVTYDKGWHFDEFGNAYNPPNAPLRRGVGAAGFRYEDDRE